MAERRRKVRFDSRKPLLGSTADHLITDPNAPKRGLSAYMFFANEQRENVREENPGIAFGTMRYNPLKCLASLTSTRFTGQVGKVLGERWKALSPPQREPYEAKAKADKERYDAEKATYAVGATHFLPCTCVG